MKTVEADLLGLGPVATCMPMMFVDTPVSVSTHNTWSSHSVSGSLRPLRTSARGVGFGKTSHGTFHSERGATGDVKWPLRTMSRFVDSASRPSVRPAVSQTDGRRPKVCNRNQKPQRRQSRPGKPSTRSKGRGISRRRNRTGLFLLVMTFFFIPPTPPSDHSSLGLVLGGLLAAGLDAGQDVLAVLVELELGDDHVAGVDREGDALAGGLVAGDALDVNGELEAVDRGDLALLVLVQAADDLDLIILADGDAPDLWKMNSSVSLLSWRRA